MIDLNIWGIKEFLSTHPKMRLTALSSEQFVLEGEFDFNLVYPGFKSIAGSYLLRIVVNRLYPKKIPKVYELKGNIPRDIDFHTYKDGSFCLGSDIRLLCILFTAPRIKSFVENILHPFLYSVSYKLKYNVFPFGDLKHEERGLIEDYQEIFGVKGKSAILSVLYALSKRPRVANKLRCPCECGKRLGKCNFRFKLHSYRLLARRRWFKEHLQKQFK